MFAGAIWRGDPDDIHGFNVDATIFNRVLIWVLTLASSHELT